MKRKRFPQDFLFECNYKDLDLSMYLFHGDMRWIQNYKEPINLLDYLNKIPTRYVPVTDLNKKIKTKTDWEQFLETIHQFRQIIFIRESLTTTNPIVNQFEENQIKAYITMAKDYEKDVFWIENQNSSNDGTFLIL